MSKDKIKQLSEKEQARQKVSIWFGSKENYYHPFKEVLFNGIDEINNNFENGKMTITLDESKKIVSITDTGRGIPINGETDGVPNYHLLLLKLFAGTNYENNESGKMTTGTNGVGLTVTNYCSKSFSVKSFRKDGIYSIKFNNGGQIEQPLKKEKNETNMTGTQICFELDDEVFSNTVYDFEEILDIAKKASGVNKKTKIIVKQGENEREFHYDNIGEYFNEISTNNTSAVIVGSEKTFELENETNQMELVLTTSPEPIQESYLNITYLKEGGSINEGIINGVKLSVNKYCKAKKLLNEKLGTLSNADIADSISFVCNFKSTNVEFSNQTKYSTGKKLYGDIAKQFTQELLEIYMIEQPKDFEKFVAHILEVQKFNNKSQASKKALKKKLSEKVDSFTKIEGLVDCKEHGENSELFICEGKSALGSVITARNPVNQAGMAIRGKIMNCLKSSYDEIFKSQIVTDIIKVLGCGIDTDKKNKDLGEFNEQALRYGKIVISTDMDADGYQIACLLLTLFYRLTPQLIKSGRIYIALTPLFEIKDLKTGTTHYAFSEEEKENIISSLEKFKISRNKGLGELDAKVMAETGVNPDTRTIVKVDIDDIKEMEKSFEIWMDEEVTTRKNIILNELDKYVDID